MTDFGKFGLKACFGGWASWKKIESRRGTAELTFNFFSKTAILWSRLWKPNFPKSVTNKQSLRLIPGPCMVVPNLFQNKIESRGGFGKNWKSARFWKKLKVGKVLEKVESRQGFGKSWKSAGLWISLVVLDWKSVRYLLVLAAEGYYGLKLFEGEGGGWGGGGFPWAGVSWKRKKKWTLIS